MRRNEEGRWGVGRVREKARGRVRAGAGRGTCAARMADGEACEGNRVPRGDAPKRRNP